MVEQVPSVTTTPSDLREIAAKLEARRKEKTMVEHLPDDSKEELIEALAAVKKAAGHYQKTLGCQIEGWGRFDSQACRLAAERYGKAVQAAAAITSETVAPLGLFREEAGR